MCSWQEKAALKEEQEKKRHKKAEEKFQEWLAKANDKRRASPKPGYDPTSEFILATLELVTTMYMISYNHVL